MALWGVLVLCLSIATIEGYSVVQRCGNSYIYINSKYYKRQFCCNERVIDRTYVVNAQSNGTDACCNGCPYNSYRFACCDGSLQPRTPNTKQACCGKKIYDINRQICCCGKIRARECGLRCCGSTFYDLYTQLCCNGVLHKRSWLRACCGLRTYHLRNELCCRGVIYKLSSFGKCCDFYDDYHYGHAHSVHHARDGAFKKREAKKFTKRQLHCPSCYHLRRNLHCCGSRVYNYSIERCCGNTVHTNKALYCCFGALYNPSTHVCCYFDRKVHNKIYGTYTGCCQAESCRNAYGYHGHLSSTDATLYHIGKYRCCSGVIVPITTSTQSCCGWGVYDYRKEKCCGQLVYERKTDYSCCGNAYYNRKTATCCCDKVISHNDPTSVSCCNGILYTGSGICCRNRWFSGSNYRGCCGDKAVYSGQLCCYSVTQYQIYYPRSQICCSGTLLNIRIVTNSFASTLVEIGNDGRRIFPIYVIGVPRLNCCDMTPYNTYTHLCCCGRLFSRKKYNSCCQKTPYNSFTHICCYNSGRIYPKTFYTSCCYGWVPYHHILRRCCGYARLVPYGTSCNA